MEKKKTGALNLGPKGLGVVILSFLACYMYSAMTSDSLNVTVGVFGQMGFNTNIIYTLSSVATVCGIVGSILFAKISEKRLRVTWACTLILAGVFSLIWSAAPKTGSMAVYAIGYLVTYTMLLVSCMLLSFNVLANWFPRKRGVALGIATAGFPLSAATTTAVCSKLAVNISNFYLIYGIIALIIGVIVFVYVRDFPEEKGAYPDNDRDFDFEAAAKEHQANLEYLKTSKWTIGKVLKTPRLWQIWIGICITGFLSMGIMANFMNKFMEQYGARIAEVGPDAVVGQIIGMLAIVGIVAIPGSVFIGWFDVKFGTKKAAILDGALAVIAVALGLTPVVALHYVSLIPLAVMLGGSSNMMTSVTAAIWGRYDFQNAFRVIQPLNAIMTGIGITVVGLIGTNFSYMAAYKVMLVMAIVALIVTIFLRVEPIDDEVR
ncbi:MAG: MFS transporter [Eubacterium sp.]|nr:MFS transporter [Eubacterium sp.]